MQDLRQLALDLIETEKQYLREDKDDYYAALVVVVTPEGNYYEEIDFKDEDEKVAAYTDVVVRAKECYATAIITINTSRQQVLAEGEDLDGYWWGKLESEGYPRALTATISGPGMNAWCLTLPFRLEGDEVVVGQLSEFEPATVALLPNWP